MTIAGLDPRFGGPSRSVPFLGNALAERGIEVEIVSLREPKAAPPVVRSVCKVTHVPCGTNRYLPSLWVRAFGRSIKRAFDSSAGPALLHDNGLWLPSNHVAARTARVGNMPRVVSPRGMLSEWARGAGAWKKRLAWVIYQKRNLQTAKVLHATARSEAEELRQLGLVQPIAVIPNGVEIPPLVRNPQIPKQALFLSRIHPKKGLINLVEAWSIVRPEDWSLTIAGPDEGNHREEVRNAIAARGLVESVRLIGAADDNAKWRLYESSDLFILPSFSENFGIVIGEALGAGIPVITTKATPWQVIEERRCGWWIDLGVPPLVAAIRQATGASPQQRSSMGERGRALVEKEFSWEAVALEFESVYQWITSGGPRPGCFV